MKSCLSETVIADYYVNIYLEKKMFPTYISYILCIFHTYVYVCVSREGQKGSLFLKCIGIVSLFLLS